MCNMLALICALTPLLYLTHAKQPQAPSAQEAPLRDVTLQQLNFLHTTDTHGWHAGHLQEPSYSADWGDYISFAARMREKAEAKGQDLLVVDTGDRIEGNGLYDASDPKGEYTFGIFSQQHIDIICAGNHELYQKNASENEYLITVPAYKDNYLASNLDISDPKTGKMVPLAPRYRKFTTTKQGIRILTFGFIFDFTGNYQNTFVQPVENTVKEAWFQEAIRDRQVDLFVVIGHVPVRDSKEYDAVYKAIRAVQWDAPIMFFGGHSHIRDYKKYDSKAYALESGRFMETIGFQSIQGLSTGSKPKPDAPLSFSRRYIDNNLFSMYSHTGLNETTFHTEAGLNVSKAIKKARSALRLDQTFGCAPKDLWMNRIPYPHNDSIFSWLETQVLPDVIYDRQRGNKPRLVITNTGGIRFDIFKGPFTRDSTFIVSPFTSGFRYIKDVPFEKARQILPILNNAGQILAETNPSVQTWSLAPPEQWSRKTNMIPTHSPLDTLQFQNILASNSKPELTPGYTTTDDLGKEGDDTIHSPITFYRVPNCIQAIIPIPTAPTPEPKVVDVIYIDFIQKYILEALKILGLEYDARKDTDVYLVGENFTTLLAKWIGEKWKGNC